jgi:Amidase
MVNELSGYPEIGCATHDPSPAEMNADLCFMPATELVARYATKSLSPVEVTRAVLDRIRALNPRLNAYCLVDEAGAHAAARASEARWLKGEPAGPVDGVPASIKDLILAQGWPTLRGSKSIRPARGTTMRPRPRACAPAAQCSSARPARRSSAGKA